MAYNFNIEPAMEAALVAILQVDNITAGGSLETEDLTTPRVDVRFELGGEREVTNPGMPQTNYVWDGQFVLSVITDRDINNGSHAAFRTGI